MLFEYKMLAGICGFFLFAYVPASLAKAKTYGIKWLGSNRDEKPTKELPLWGQRCERAHSNLKDNLPAFIAAVLILGQTGGFNETTKTLSLMYVAARLLHFMAYGFGRSNLRATSYLVGLICNSALIYRIFAI